MKSILWIFGLSCLIGLARSNTAFNREDAEDDDNDQIVGGTQAAKGEFPYQARINIRDYSTPKTFDTCGGTLIGPSHILTAAHCFDDFPAGSPYSDIEILLDTILLGGDKDSIKVKSIMNIYIHESYNKKTMYNDIALITISDKITQIKPIALPTKITETYAGKTATVIGWGALKEGGAASPNLQKTSVTVMSESDCAKIETDINKLKLCAASPGKDSCQGDSGGPLICDGVQIGVVSYGKGCADPKYPGVYVRLTSYLDWIERAKKRF